MCYENWSESEPVTRAMEKARKETDNKMIDKAKTAPRPEPEKEVRQLEEQVVA